MYLQEVRFASCCICIRYHALHISIDCSSINGNCNHIYKNYKKDGESGRKKKKKINQITRWLTILITLVQVLVYIYNLYRTFTIRKLFMLAGPNIHFFFSSYFSNWNYFCNVVSGRKITDKGIGNGISLLIMVGIIVRSFIQEFSFSFLKQMEVYDDCFELILWLLVIIACILLVMAVKKIPVTVC